ncbi:hypothetical protein N0V90_000931 [Kalmusia sp. IMI 367209]|nr:hypothetical protein N0V90_000931 [Kalmusia sp. IMI 367209]
MPTLSSTLTSTATLFVTLASGYPGVPVIPDVIHGLPNCGQDVIFPLLANSKCNPADFPCICLELEHLKAHEAVAAACPDDMNKYLEFSASTCGEASSVVYVTGTSVPATSVASTTAVPVTSAVPSNGTVVPSGSIVPPESVGPSKNATVPPVGPTLTETAVVPIASESAPGGAGGAGPGETGKAGGAGGAGGAGPEVSGSVGGGAGPEVSGSVGGGAGPEVSGSVGGGAGPEVSGSVGGGAGPEVSGSVGGGAGPEVSGSVGGGAGSGNTTSPASPSEQPSSPEFEGAAVAEFGSGRLAVFAGIIGMMGLAFADL